MGTARMIGVLQDGDTALNIAILHDSVEMLNALLRHPDTDCNEQDAVGGVREVACACHEKGGLIERRWAMASSERW